MATERPERGPGGAASRPPEEDERGRRILERILPEIIKRAVEAGVEKIQEGPENLRNFLHDLKLPREVVGLILAQIDETKNGLYRVVAKEIRDFLEHTSMADELSRALTRLSFEIKTEIRFVPNDAAPPTPEGGRLPKPDVKTSVAVKTDRKSDRPPP